MKKETVWTSEYFCGNKISEYGLQHKRVDYRTLAKSFDAVLANDLISKTWGIVGEWETINGNEYDDENESYVDIFQYYIISNNGVDILQDYTDEIIFYNEELDLYIWGVTHYGTSWDYVLTDIKIELNEKC